MKSGYKIIFIAFAVVFLSRHSRIEQMCCSRLQKKMQRNVTRTTISLPMA